MPAQLSKLPANLRSVLAGFTAGQKAMTALALVALVIGGVVFTSWAAKPAMVPVFTNLESSDAAAITEELTSRGTQFSLADGGATVLVPQQDVYQLRLDLSAAGLPENSKGGWEIMDNAGITTSEAQQRVNYQRALEGELAKTITSIDGVEAATVHLVMPEEKLFESAERQPTASVLVKMKAGKTIAPGQVQAVTNMVANSVEGLDPARISIADAKGTVLSAVGADGATTAAGDARATQTGQFEQGLKESVENLLTPVVGAGKAVVSVKAVLDFDKRESVSEIFGTDGKEPLTVSETTAIEKYVGTGTVIGGVLGPENVDTDLDGGENTYDKEQASRQLAVDKVTETRTSAPGKVERMSVAVILDAAAAGTVAPAEIETLVAAATGVDEARGDVVEVSRIAFDDSAAKAAEEEFAALEAAEKDAQRMSLIRTVGTLLVVGLMLLYALRTMRRDKREDVELPFDLEAQQLALEAEQAAALAAAEARRALEPAPLTVEEQQRLTIQGEIGELVERQPEEVAQLLRGWLADRRS